MSHDLAILSKSSQNPEFPLPNSSLFPFPPFWSRVALAPAVLPPPGRYASSLPPPAAA